MSCNPPSISTVKTFLTRRLMIKLFSLLVLGELFRSRWKWIVCSICCFFFSLNMECLVCSLLKLFEQNDFSFTGISCWVVREVGTVLAVHFQNCSSCWAWTSPINVFKIFVLQLANSLIGIDQPMSMARSSSWDHTYYLLYSIDSNRQWSEYSSGLFFPDGFNLFSSVTYTEQMCWH